MLTRKSRSLEHILDNTSSSSSGAGSSYTELMSGAGMSGLTTLPRLRRCEEVPGMWRAAYNYTDTMRSAKSVTSIKSVQVRDIFIWQYIISRNLITKEIARKQKINELSLRYRRKSGQSQRSESNWIIEKELEKSGHGQFRTTIIKWNTVADFARFCPENIRSFCLLNQ